MDRGAWWAAVHVSLRIGHDWVTSLSLFTFMHWRRKWQCIPVFLPGESHGRRTAWWAGWPGGLPSIGSHRVRHDWNDLAAAAWIASLVVLISLRFCLSVKLLIFPSYMNEILDGYSNLGCRFFSFITLSMSCVPFWPEEFQLKDQLLSLWESPCVLFVVFPLLLLIIVLFVRYWLIWLICVWDISP